MGIKNFTEIKAWQEAKKLAIFAYQLTKKEYFKKDFSLARQLQSSTVSTMANIAEGFGR
ncbi:MAG: four helix bundle protein, partial [Candidatus Margulisbacteria bacterium]|nr:four helix bundle protein [Candidatus Margulisiibacteriota bacterium]